MPEQSRRGRSEETSARCRQCGKRWPSSVARCPDDGSELGDETREQDLHSQETAVLPAGRQRRDQHDPGSEAAQTDVREHQTADAQSATAETTAPDNFGFETTIDAGQEQRDDFDPFGSDVRTYQVHIPKPDEPQSGRVGSKSSDPPTVFVRRSECHIELPPGSMVDEYEIDNQLGAGAMGEVYAARHVKLGKRVAIKVISPRLSEDSAAVERFAQEARTLALMHHPGLVDVLGFGELADGRAYFVMELLSGRSLFDCLQHGRLDRAEALDVFGQIARALEAAHTHGVVHRDLKPENIFLAQVTNEPRPVVKLLDFGLARLEVEVDRRTERTQSGVVIGTAMYLSPEQARGPDVDGRTDVYALGCVGFELLLGRHPFEDARTVAALIAAHLHEPPPLPSSFDPSIPSEIDTMLFAMLAKDPRLRPTLPQIRSVVDRMRTAASAPPHPTSTVRSAPMSTGSRSINRRTIALAGAVLVVGIVIGAASRGSRSDANRPAQTTLPARVDAGDTLAQAAPTVPDAPLPDAPLVDAASTTRSPIDAGVARPRVEVVQRHQADASVDIADAGITSGSSVDAGPVPDAESAVDAAPERTVPIQPPSRGYVRILPPQGAQVLVDGSAPVGPLSKLPLAPGKHKIQFSVGSNTDTFTVTIAAGGTVTLDKRDLYRSGRGSDDRNRTVNPFEKKPAPR